MNFGNFTKSTLSKYIFWRGDVLQVLMFGVVDKPLAHNGQQTQDKSYHLDHTVARQPCTALFCCCITIIIHTVYSFIWSCQVYSQAFVCLLF